jgi:hypothetical protein
VLVYTGIANTTAIAETPLATNQIFGTAATIFRTGSVTSGGAEITAVAGEPYATVSPLAAGTNLTLAKLTPAQNAAITLKNAIGSYTSVSDTTVTVTDHYARATNNLEIPAGVTLNIGSYPLQLDAGVTLSGTGTIIAVRSGLGNPGRIYNDFAKVSTTAGGATADEVNAALAMSGNTLTIAANLTAELETTFDAATSTLAGAGKVFLSGSGAKKIVKGNLYEIAAATAYIDADNPTAVSDVNGLITALGNLSAVQTTSIPSQVILTIKSDASLVSGAVLTVPTGSSLYLTGASLTVPAAASLAGEGYVRAYSTGADASLFGKVIGHITELGTRNYSVRANAINAALKIDTTTHTLTIGDYITAELIADFDAATNTFAGTDGTNKGTIIASGTGKITGTGYNITTKTPAAGGSDYATAQNRDLAAAPASDVASVIAVANTGDIFTNRLGLTENMIMELTSVFAVPATVPENYGSGKIFTSGTGKIVKTGLYEITVTAADGATVRNVVDLVRGIGDGTEAKGTVPAGATLTVYAGVTLTVKLGEYISVSAAGASVVLTGGATPAQIVLPTGPNSYTLAQVGTGGTALGTIQPNDAADIVLTGGTSGGAFIVDNAVYGGPISATPQTFSSIKSSTVRGVTIKAGASGTATISSASTIATL